MSSPSHTFGGSALDRHVFDFEPGDGDPSLVMPEPTPSAYPAEPAVAEPAEPAWAPSQDEWAAVTQGITYLAQLEQQRASLYTPAADQQGARFDPYADDPDTLLRQVIREELAPFAQTTESIKLGEAEQRAMDILADVESREGEFDKQMARTRASEILPAMQQKYGHTPQAAVAALEQAAADQRAYEQKMYEAAVAKYTNQISTLAGAAHEPGSSYSTGVQTRTVPDYRQGGSVAARFFGQQAQQ